MAKKIKIETSKKKEKWNIFSKENNFSATAISGPRIEIFSNNTLILEGCYGILEYNDIYLKLRIQKGALMLEGADFDIVSFEDKTIVINGKFLRFEFVV